MLDLLTRLWRRGPSAPPPAAASGEDVRAFLSAPRVYGAVDRERLRDTSSAMRAQIIASADAAVAHRFNLLGSGPYVPADPDRPRRDDYTPIDWTLDPVAGARFPNTMSSAGCDIAAIRPPRADIKRPWELARCYHWATLGQAWLLSGEPVYARELIRQGDDFMEANPVGRGIQWTCTMDVAIRAANWVIGLELVRDAPIPEADWIRAVDAVLAHGRFVRGHLENHYEVTSNHFLSNVVGLFIVGLGCRHRDEAQEWIRFAHGALETEMQTQVLADGMDFESSIPYHRLVTELFFAGWRAAQVAGMPLSSSYESRLRQMHGVLAAVLRPDGLMPQVGDADDGRLHVFRGHDVQVPQDPRHVFGPAAAAFGERSYLPLAGPEAQWDALWWGLSVDAQSFAPPASSAFLPDAGLLVQRDDDGSYLLITNAAVGTRGFGNHKHNDLLSFEYHVNGRALVVDPGSYVYTSDPESRNLFRSVVSHSSVAVRGAEPNEFKPEWLFRMFEKASPRHLVCERAPASLRYSGAHEGFSPHGVTVTRSFEWEPGLLRIVDDIVSDAENAVPLEWRFQLDPAVMVNVSDASAIELVHDAARVWLSAPGELRITIEPGWCSPSYGVRRPSRQIVCRDELSRGSREWTFSFATASVDRPR